MAYKVNGKSVHLGATNWRKDMSAWLANVIIWAKNSHNCVSSVHEYKETTEAEMRGSAGEWEKQPEF